MVCLIKQDKFNCRCVSQVGGDAVVASNVERQTFRAVHGCMGMHVLLRIIRSRSYRGNPSQSYVLFKFVFDGRVSRTTVGTLEIILNFYFPLKRTTEMRCSSRLT